MIMGTINVENLYKEICKRLIDSSIKYNDFQKEVLKTIVDVYYEERKRTISKKQMIEMNLSRY